MIYNIGYLFELNAKDFSQAIIYYIFFFTNYFHHLYDRSYEYFNNGYFMVMRDPAKAKETISKLSGYSKDAFYGEITGRGGVRHYSITYNLNGGSGNVTLLASSDVDSVETNDETPIAGIVILFIISDAGMVVVKKYI